MYTAIPLQRSITINESYNFLNGFIITVDVTPDAVYANSGYLGCSDDSKLTSINPGNYDATNMSPGVCREICGQRNYKYAQLRQGEQCLCDNKSTGYEPLDKCFMPCTGNKLARCGGENYVSVYNTPNFVQARVNLSGPEKVLIDKFFILNTTLNLPNFNTLSEYHFQVSDGTSLRTAATSFEHAFVYPGNYTVKVIATIEHNETGLVTQLTAEKNIFVEMAELNATQFRCPAIITTNLAITCSVEIQEASGVEMQMLIDQELNETFAVTGIPSLRHFDYFFSKETLIYNLSRSLSSSRLLPMSAR